MINKSKYDKKTQDPANDWIESQNVVLYFRRII